MTVRTQAHHPVTNGIIPSAGTEANFAELYDLQDGGIDGSNMDLTATFAWTGAHSFTDVVNFDSGLLYVDATNNRIYEGTTTTTTIDSIDYQHQIIVLSAATPAFALISTATGSTGVREARYHNSASPAASDQIYHQKIYANNSSSVVKEFARVTAQIHTVTAGAEDGLWYVSVMKAGTLTNTLLAYHDQVQVRPESLVVGTNTNLEPVSGNVAAIYATTTNSARRVAVLESVDATASGAIFDIYKNSASPAASDIIAQLRFVGNDSAGAVNVYGEIISRIVSPTNGSENGQMDLKVIVTGSSTNFLSAVSTAGSVEVTVTGQLTVVGNTNSITSTNATGDAFTITANSLTSGSALVVTSNSSGSTGNIISFIGEHASASADVCYIRQDANALALNIDMNGAFNALQIDHDGASGAAIIISMASNSATNVSVINVNGSNSGAGNLIGIDFSSLSGTADFILSADSQGAAAGVAPNRRIKVLIDGVAEYFYSYAS